MDTTINELGNSEVAIALELAWKVLMECEALDYSQEGSNEFRCFLNNQNEIKKRRFWGCFEPRRIVPLEETCMILRMKKLDLDRKGLFFPEHLSL